MSSTGSNSLRAKPLGVRIVTVPVTRGSMMMFSWKVSTMMFLTSSRTSPFSKFRLSGARVGRFRGNAAAAACAPALPIRQNERLQCRFATGLNCLTITRRLRVRQTSSFGLAGGNTRGEGCDSTFRRLIGAWPHAANSDDNAATAPHTNDQRTLPSALVA